MVLVIVIMRSHRLIVTMVAHQMPDLLLEARLDFFIGYILQVCILHFIGGFCLICHHDLKLKICLYLSWAWMVHTHALVNGFIFTLHREAYFLYSKWCKKHRHRPTYNILELVMPVHAVKVTTIVLTDTHITYTSSCVVENFCMLVSTPATHIFTDFLYA